MTNKSIARSFAVLALFSVLLIFGSEADARSQLPIFEDEIVASVNTGSAVWIAPILLKAQLEAHTGQTAAVDTLGSLLSQIASANGSNSVRFEGGHAAGQALGQLHSKGYDTDNDGTALIEDSDGASVWTD